MKIKFDFSNLIGADDGDTVHFGGYIGVNDVNVQCTGSSDRDFNWVPAVMKIVGNYVGRPLTDEEDEDLWEKLLDTEDFEVDL